MADRAWLGRRWGWFAFPPAQSYVRGMQETITPAPSQAVQADAPPPAPSPAVVRRSTPLPKEIGGSKGPEPTRYGDWEHKGRCTDF